MKKKYLIIVSIVLVLVISLWGFIFLNNDSNIAMSYPEFLEAVNEDKVNKVIFSENSHRFNAQLIGEEDILYNIPNPKSQDFTEFLLLEGIEIDYSNGFINSQGFQIIVLLLIAGGAAWYILRGRNNIAKDANKKSERKNFTTLNQVAGNMEAKFMVEDIIEFIKDPEKYSTVGANMPKGLLFYGPPGTGKTLMAKATAGEADVPFYSMSGSDFVQMYVGVGASRIRNLFKKAKKNEKAVIFIDEIDAIGKKRGNSPSASNDERDQTLNALLTEMSGFHENKGIIVIAATNRLDTLDEALLRPGRFDRQIEIGLPDVNARNNILSLYAKSKPLAEDVDLEAISKSTVYFSGAMLENLLNEAAINAANDKKTTITQDHIDKAFYTVLAGSPKQDRSYISEKDRKITAFHEAGHALATKLLQPEHYISKVTIIPSVRGAGGFNLSIPKDTLYQSQKEIQSTIKVLLAGRVAEELIFGPEEITTGASSDIKKASSILVDYINKFGMDADMGLFNVEVLGNGHDSHLISKYREEMNDLYKETKELIGSNIELLKGITNELLEKESLKGEDIDRICS